MLKKKRYLTLFFTCAAALFSNASSALTCSVTTDSWSDGFVANITVNNDSNAGINSWEVALNFNQSITVSSSWSADISTSGNTVTASNMSYNASLAAGQSTSFGFQGTHSGNFQDPDCITGTSPTPAPTATPIPSNIPTPTPEPDASSVLEVELESFAGQSAFSPFAVQSDSAASGGQYVLWPNNGSDQNNPSASDSTSGQIHIGFSLSEATTVSLLIAANLPSLVDDSFYYRVNSDPWSTQNDTQTNGWENLSLGSVSLNAGSHSFSIQRREDGSQLDKLTLTAANGAISASSVTTPEPTPTPEPTSIPEPIYGSIYVSTTGSDNGSGTASSPYRSLAKAAENAGPGDTVLVRGGGYVASNITPASSGQEGNYIVFRAMPNTGNVTIRHSSSSDNSTPVFNLSNRSYIWIEGFHFKDFTHGLASIYINNGEGNVVVNNRFENLGNSQVSPWNGNQVVGVFNSTKTVVCNNYFNNVFGDGVNVNSQRSQRNLICNNSFSRFKGKLRSWGGSYTFSRAVDVQDHSNGNNVVAFNHAVDVVHHVWLDRDGSNNIVLRNFGKTGSGNVFNESRCANNLIQENIAVGMSTGYMTSYYTSTGWTEDARWVSNVAYNNSTGFNVHKSRRDEFRNNIVYNNGSYNIRFSDAALNNGPHIFRNNLWYSSNSNNSIYLGGIPQATESGGSTYSGSASSVSNFQSRVGESGGLSTNPQFNGSEDFTLQASSPAKNAGDNGLDLGAYAYYPRSTTGWNAAANSSAVAVYFDQSISSVSRGNSINLTVRLSQAASSPVSVDIVPVAGDAVIGSDFTLSSNSLTFSPGETSKTLTLSAQGSFQHDELVALRLQNASGATASGRTLHAVRVN